MAWINGLERKRFNEEQKRLAEQYRAAGMTEEQIEQMYQFDLVEFNSRRRFSEHTQQFSENAFEESDDDKSPLLEKYLAQLSTSLDFSFAGDRYGWVEEIEKPELIKGIKALSKEDIELIIIIDPEAEYRPLVEGLGGEVIEISATSPNHINALDMESGYNDGDNPVVLKSEFLLSLCEQLVGAGKLSAKEKSIIDRCTAQVYREFIRNGYLGVVPTLQDFHAALLEQPEPEARDVALALELFTEGSLNTFAKYTNVDTNSRILCYDIRDLGKQLLPVGMLVVLDSVFNRIIRNRKLGKNTWLYIDEIYLLFQHEYSANFLFTLWKRMRKYGACGTGLTQNVDDLLQSHTARTMLANSEFLLMLNQASTDRIELARLLNISDNQLSYISGVDFGHGLLKCGSTIVPFVDHFPKNGKLYQLMTTKLSERVEQAS